VNVGSLVRRILGARGNLRKIRFREAGRVLEWYVPDDTLWLAVKDNLVLSDYEQMGISLPAIKGLVIDAGANVGLFSLRAALYADRVVALEPHPEILPILRLNMFRSASFNVEVRPKALWIDSTGVELVEGQDSAGSSVFGTSGRRFQVESTTLDDLVEEVGKVELLKLDIEGAEFQVLLGCQSETLAQISAIVAEVHLEERAAMLPALVERLRGFGFETVVRERPIHYWRESMRRTITGWSDVVGLTPLKISVITIYSLVGLGRALSLPVEPERDRLKLLYAVRENPSA